MEKRYKIQELPKKRKKNKKLQNAYFLRKKCDLDMLSEENSKMNLHNSKFTFYFMQLSECMLLEKLLKIYKRII